MILPIQNAVRRHMSDAVRRLYDIPAEDPVLATIPVELPPRRALGDLSVPLAFDQRVNTGSRVTSPRVAGRVDVLHIFERRGIPPDPERRARLSRKYSAG